MTKPKARFTRGRKNYYAIPNPATGQITELFNVSALSKVLDNFAINRWKLDTVARVVGGRKDLQMLATSGNERQAQENALDAENQKANIGTAIHSVTEMMDDGTFDWELCPAGADLYALQYQRAKDTYGLQRLKAEYTVYNFEYGYAGTTDGVWQLDWSKVAWRGVGTLPKIGDVKTGSGIYPDIAIQLAAYAFAEGGWVQEGDEPGEGHHVEIPEVDREWALGILLHEDSCQVLPVSLKGFDRVLAALAVIRDKPTRGVVGKPLQVKEVTGVDSNLGSIPAGGGGVHDDAGSSLGLVVEGPEAVDGVQADSENAAPASRPTRPAARGLLGGRSDADQSDAVGAYEVGEPVVLPATAASAAATDAHGFPTQPEAVATAPDAGKIKARIAGLPVEAKGHLSKNWPAGVPKFKGLDRLHTADELTAIEQACWLTESWFGVDFPAADILPAVEQIFPASTEVTSADPDGEPITDDNRAELRALLGALPRATFHEIERVAKAEGIPNIANAFGHADPFLQRHYVRLFEIIGQVNVEVAERKAAGVTARAANKKQQTATKESELTNV